MFLVPYGIETGFGGFKKLWSCKSQCRKNSARGKVIDKKWFIRIGTLWGLQTGKGDKRVLHIENLVGYSFIIKGKAGRGERPLSSSFLSRCQVSIIGSPSTLGRGVFLSLCGQTRTVMALWKGYFRSQYSDGLSLWRITFLKVIIIFYVCREHVLGVINLLNSLVRLWVSCHHCFIVLRVCLVLLLHGFVTKRACLILWLRKPGFLEWSLIYCGLPKPPKVSSLSSDTIL